MRSERTIRHTIEFLQEILKDEHVNEIKLANSFISSLYTNEKFNEVKTSLVFQISDGDFLFTVNIKKDKDGNIIMFSIKKDDI